MTYRDWMKEHHPENMDEGWNGGVKGCPYDYQLEPRSERPCCSCEHITCEECWNREMPEEPTKTAAETPKDDSVKDDPVNHPTHYTSGGVECIDAISAALCKYTDGVDAWLAGQVIKYLWRAPLKENYTQDIAKAKFYMDRLARRQEKTE